MSAAIYRLDFDCRDGRVYSYWGSSVKWKQRIHAHRSALRKGKHINSKMQSVFDKHGDFKESVVMLCARESLAEDERCMIARHYGRAYCLNLTMETVSVMRDPEVKRRQIEALRAVQQTEKYRRNRAAAMAKVYADPQWQKNHRAGVQKRMADPQWQKNHRAGVQKRSQDPEWRANVAASNREALNKKVELTMPSGEVRVLESLTVAAGEIGVPMGTLSQWLRGQSPWPGQGQRLLKKYTHLAGLHGRYL